MSIPFINYNFSVHTHTLYTHSCTLYSAVGGILDNLHGIATDMGDELDRQNHQLGRINNKADVNVAHLGSANQRMRRQL